MQLESKGSGHRAPVTFDGCAGWLHQGAGDVGVVMCGAWGFEELCMRRAWRMLADALAAAGYSTLRFDYPGAGDSLGRPQDLPGLARLAAAAGQAAATLKRRTGVRRVVVIGQGLGAVVAALAAPTLGAEGVVLLSPPAKGREHLRELSVWSAMVAQSMEIAPDADAPGAVAGFDMPETIRAALAVVDLTGLERPPAAAVLVLTPHGRAGPAKLAQRLRSLGAELTELPYAGYEAALGNPTASRPPVEAWRAVLQWIGERFPAGAGAAAAPSEPAVLEDQAFVETAVQIGPRGLCGVLCEPRTARRGATVLMLSAGGDPHIGWARSHVDYARELASDGIASLRLDGSDIGDSPGPLSDAPIKLYDQRHVDDAIAALDWLEGRGLGPVLPVGRCSGAFAAFNAALRDRRLTRLIQVNQRRYIWDRDGVMERASEKVSHYRKQARNPASLLIRWIRGELDLEAALAKATSAAGALLAAALRGERRRQAAAHMAACRALADQGVEMDLIYSRGGEAWADVEHFFGPGGRRLRRFANVRLIWMDDADHAVTPRPARQRLLAMIRAAALGQPLGSAGVAAEQPPPGREDLPVGDGLPAGVRAA